MDAARGEVYDKIILKSWTHRLLHLTPQIQSFLKENPQIIVADFLETYFKKPRVLDWQMHWDFLNWLYAQATLDENIIFESLRSIVIHWSLENLQHLNAPGIIVASQHLPTQAIGLLKSASPQDSHQIFSLPTKRIKQDTFAILKMRELSQLEWMCFKS